MLLSDSNELGKITVLYLFIEYGHQQILWTMKKKRPKAHLKRQRPALFPKEKRRPIKVAEKATSHRI
jgi:hypothetical protein